MTGGSDGDCPANATTTMNNYRENASLPSAPSASERVLDYLLAIAIGLSIAAMLVWGLS
mgnify:CR=1 FL=1